MRLDMTAIKAEIRRLAEDLHQSRTCPAWTKRKTSQRYTMLCALRAHMRGKLHFAPSTNLAEAYFILNVPCYEGSDVVAGSTRYRFKQIDAAVQEAWVKDAAQEFALHVPPDVAPCVA